MESYERQFAEAVVDDLSTSIANNVREAIDVDALVEDEQNLTTEGRMYVRGYVVGRLTMLRAGAVGNPNLSAGDLERITEIVDRNESGIAAALYA
jgi:hypothetical protein